MVAHTRKHRRRLMRALARSRNAALLTETTNTIQKQTYFTVVLGEPPLLIHIVEAEDPET